MSEYALRLLISVFTGILLIRKLGHRPERQNAINRTTAIAMGGLVESRAGTTSGGSGGFNCGGPVIFGL